MSTVNMQDAQGLYHEVTAGELVRMILFNPHIFTPYHLRAISLAIHLEAKRRIGDLSAVKEVRHEV